MKKLMMMLAVGTLIVGCKSTNKTENGQNDVVGVQAADITSKGSDGGAIEGLQTVHFDYDKSSLNETEMKKLEGNAAWLKKNADAKMSIEGHCDQAGSAEYNLSLGERRANAVKQELQKMGIKAARLSTVSYGKEKLLTQGSSEEEMAKNRRANFVPAK